MSFKRISILVLILLSLAAAVSLITGNPFAPGPKETPAPVAVVPPAPAPPPASKPPAPPAVQPAPAPAAVAPPPLLEQVEEEDMRSEKEQVEAALAQLTSADPQQRIDGAEELGAFPTKEAEAALVQALTSDSEADVRNAAAQSLGDLENPADTTLAALLAALEDQNEEVRASALSTLEDFLVETEEGSKRYKKLMADLKAKGAARSTPKDVRDAIRDILADQAEN
jgi:hypothetical protein